MLNITDEFDNFTKFTQIVFVENNNINILFEFLILSIPGSVILLSLTALIIYSTPKPLITNKEMENFLFPTHPDRCISTVP